MKFFFFLLCCHQFHSSLQIFGERPITKCHDVSVDPFKQTDRHTYKNADMAAFPLFEILQTRLKIGGGLLKFQSVVPRHCVRRISKYL